MIRNRTGLKGSTGNAFRAAVMVAVTVWALPSPASYRDLAEDLANYRPGGLYEAYRKAPPPPPERPAGTGDEFEAQKKALEAARKRWEQALEAGTQGTPFYKPDPVQLQRLAPAARDDAKAARLLEGGFVIGELETLAWLRSPGVRAAERALRATLERYTQAWNLDEILRQYTAFTEALMTGVGPMKGREPVPMRFPFPGVLALKGEIVAQEVRAAAETLEIARRTAVTAARRAYWDLVYLEQAEVTTREMLILLERLEAVATTRYEAGRTSFQDVIKVRIRRQILEEDLGTLMEKQRTVHAKIRELLALPPATPIGAPLHREPPRIVPGLDPLYALAVERRQELRRLRARIGKMERMIELAETRIYPAYTLNLSLYADEAVNQVGTARTREPFPTTVAASAGAGLPKMPWYGTGDAYVREVRQKLRALRQELRRAEERVRYEVRRAWFELDRAAREEALYAKSVVDLSRAALEVSSRGYEAGRVAFADVIGSYTAWLQANLTLARKRADLGIAWAELERAVGVSGAGAARAQDGQGPEPGSH